MVKRGKNEGFRVLEDFVCEAIHDPAFLKAAALRQGHNEGMHVVEECPIDFGCTDQVLERDEGEATR